MGALRERGLFLDLWKRGRVSSIFERILRDGK